MLSLQVLALTLVPLMAGIVPQDGSPMVAPLAAVGIEQVVSAEFMVGTWRHSDEVFRWGPTDTGKSHIRASKGPRFMTLRADGTMKMVNLFRPEEGRWELTGQGLVLNDPQFPGRPVQVVHIRKRDENRIWVLLPFSGGATGIGMVRVATEEADQDDTMAGNRRAPSSRYKRNRAGSPVPVPAQEVPLRDHQPQLEQPAPEQPSEP